MPNSQTPVNTLKTQKPNIEVKAKPLSKQKPRYILGAILLVMLLVGITATYWLTQQSQDIRQQAGYSPYECENDEDCGMGEYCEFGSCVGGGGGAEICSDGVDNDGDGRTDCDDPDCSGSSFCYPPPTNPPGGEICSDGIDNDGDGRTDCDDPDCSGSSFCYPPPTNPPGGEICSDGIDNDGDGRTDCEDPDCDGNPFCYPPTNPPTTPPSNPPTNPPTSSPSPSPFTPPGPQCLDITMNYVDGGVANRVMFTCAEVVGAESYIFRVMNPNGIISGLESNGNVSIPYSVDQNGQYFAQCQICTVSGCHSWEVIPQ